MINEVQFFIDGQPTFYFWAVLAGAIFMSIFFAEAIGRDAKRRGVPNVGCTGSIMALIGAIVGLVTGVVVVYFPVIVASILLVGTIGYLVSSRHNNKQGDRK